MKTIQNHELEKLIAAGDVIEKDHHGPKVILLSGDRYLKIFYHKNRISMAKLRSRASQFADNAKKLKKRGITTIGILDVFCTKQPRRDCVLYHGIPGNTVRHVLQNNTDNEKLSEKLGNYIAQLHDAGVMFRSLHMGNIIQLADGTFGLIDIADMRVNLFSLHKSQRRRNFQHIFRYQEDLSTLDLKAFEKGYLEDVATQTHQYYRDALNAVRPSM